MDDVQVRGAATDIFSYLVEYNPSMVREFVMQESQQNDDVSIYFKIKLVFCYSGVYKVKFLCFSGHPPHQPDHRTYDLRYRPRAGWSSAANGLATDSVGSREHVGYCKCEFAHF